ncbi:HAD-IIIC family phosphatase [Accumulibacter sp.]|uniref:HAD-IIIC family phosphatase n=1 Tax=Accumulibacter sp. TaxID=2053492 RepID=UPI0035ADE644
MSKKPSAEGYGTVFAEVASMEAAAATFRDEVKVLVLRQITVEGMDTLIKRHLFPQQIRPLIEFGGYGTMVQDILASDGPVARSNPDVIVLALALDALDQNYGSPGWKMNAIRAELTNVFELLVSSTRATVAVHNFIAPLWSEQGLVTDTKGFDLASQVAELNRFVLDTVRAYTPRFVLMDWDRYLRQLGTDAALDERSRYLWRAPFKRAFLDLWARQISRLACALRGKAKKVVVLDCDNTLWGGVIGEDGMDGIQLDAHQYPGRAFFDFQTTLLHLAKRGVLLTLCSKNNEADVFEVLDGHPWCRIRRDNLASWRVNWNDKVTNITELANDLNLGLDSFVFVDDNPAECALVAEMMPQVTVLQVPNKLHELPYLLLRDGLFDTLRVTEEDKERASLYQEESQRKTARSTYGNIEAYTRSLQTVAIIHRVTPAEVSRVAQLTQKTNQFNLTTRRYSEQEIRSFVADEDTAVYSLTARDRFGTLGLVGVLIVRLAGHTARVDTFLLSCRALGRRLEDAMMQHCVSDLHAVREISSWEAEYIPTAKNAQVAEFWPRFGFDEVNSADGRKAYACASCALICNTTTFVEVEKD